MQLISYQSKTGLVTGRCVTDVAYQFNLTLLQNYELTWKYFNMFVSVQDLVLHCCSWK